MKLYRRNTVTQSAYTSAYSSWYASLSVPQQAALYHYTDSGYRSLNHNLRYGKPLPAADAAMCGHLDDALATAATNMPPRTLYRGVRALRDSIEVGQKITYPYFLSTTSDPHQLFKFTDAARPVIFEIETTDGVEISDIHPEFEFLLPRNTTFEVTGILNDVAWHAEYPDTDHSRALHDATVITLKQRKHDNTPATKLRPGTAGAR